MEFINLISNVQDLFGTKNFIPLHAPSFFGKEKDYVLDTITSTFVSSVGLYVDKVEEQLSTITKTAKATAVVNGTSALQVSLRIVGIQLGDEVLSQALTFVATTNAIIYNGANPVFIDVDRDTMGMSPVALEAWLDEFGDQREEGVFNKKSGKRISACLPMHTFGFMCRIKEISTICHKWGIPLIEDAAESLGSAFEGKPAGSWGVMGAFSFNGNKIITSGGGGAIVSLEPKWAERAKYLTTTAKRPHSYEYVHDEVGYNFRMPNLNAALLSAQIEQLGDFIANKKRLYEAYQELFIDESVDLVPIPTDQSWNYWLMSIKCADKIERDLLLRETNRHGVMTRPIWQLMYRLPMFEHCQKDSQVNAKYLEERIVNIPSSVRKNG
jgi:aminotransferase in exopolysaccharide biosynthesis